MSKQLIYKYLQNLLSSFPVNYKDFRWLKALKNNLFISNSSNCKKLIIGIFDTKVVSKLDIKKKIKKNGISYKTY